MTTKSREVGVKIHNNVSKGIRALGRGIAKLGRTTGHGVKVAAVSVKDVAVGAVTGRTEEEQKQLELELVVAKAQRMQLDPESKLYKDLVKD